MGGWHLAHKIQTEPTILMRDAVALCGEICAKMCRMVSIPLLNYCKNR